MRPVSSRGKSPPVSGYHKGRGSSRRTQLPRILLLCQSMKHDGHDDTTDTTDCSGKPIQEGSAGAVRRVRRVVVAVVFLFLERPRRSAAVSAAGVDPRSPMPAGSGEKD